MSSIPVSQEQRAVPSHAAQKYDRQLRLWGEHGQRKLSSATVCLVNASATGAEVMKNLVLPGTEKEWSGALKSVMHVLLIMIS